jgi:hypothetical protein
MPMTRYVVSPASAAAAAATSATFVKYEDFR